MPQILITILVTFFAGMGAGLGTGFAGMSAAAVISPIFKLAAIHKLAQLIFPDTAKLAHLLNGL